MLKISVISRILLGVYLLSVGVAFGGIVVLDFVQDTILNADALLRLNDFASSITRYDQCIILSDVLDKFRYILIFVAIVVLSYDSLSFRFQKSNFFVWILGVLNTILMFLYSFFYAPKIVQVFQQEPKITATPQAESLLSGAQIVLEILIVTLLLSFFARIIIMGKTTRQY